MIWICGGMVAVILACLVEAVVTDIKKIRRVKKFRKEHGDDRNSNTRSSSGDRSA